jgi:hypothetical protein
MGEPVVHLLTQTVAPEHKHADPRPDFKMLAHILAATWRCPAEYGIGLRYPETAGDGTRELSLRQSGL